MITSAWITPISTRPRVSPAMTVAAEVGVARIRRERPSLRVSMRAKAPLRAIRKEE
jgi:hypothetical protein